MPGLTPIRVRGKRSATSEEKWHTGKKRKLVQQTVPASLAVGSNAETRSSNAVPRKRIQQRIEQSRLEQLPAEIVQDIFVRSGNTNLPLTCKSLMNQLSSRHLYMSVTSSVMAPFQSQDAKPGSMEILAARRLFNYEAFPEAAPKEVEHTPDRHRTASHYASLVARKLSHLPAMPSRKLLVGPWTPDHISFFRTITRPCFSMLDNGSADCELAYEGLEQAVAEGVWEAVDLIFQRIGLKPTTNLLCKAVIQYGCNEKVVKLLLDRGGQDLDLLTPALWSWAETIDRRDDDKGSWLIKELKQRAS